MDVYGTGPLGPSRNDVIQLGPEEEVSEKLTLHAYGGVEINDVMLIRFSKLLLNR